MQEKIKMFVLKNMCSEAFNIKLWGMFVISACVNLVNVLPGFVRTSISIIMLLCFVSKSLIMWATNTESKLISENADF